MYKGGGKKGFLMVCKRLNRGQIHHHADRERFLTEFETLYWSRFIEISPWNFSPCIKCLLYFDNNLLVYSQELGPFQSEKYSKNTLVT